MELSALNEYIYKRKSVRNYINTPVDGETIEGLVDFLSEQKPPAGDIEWDFDTLPYTEMAGITARAPGVKAPHYLVLRSEQKPLCLQNSGYLGELAALWLCARGLGSCWQGGISVVNDFKDCLPFITALAFGNCDEPFRGQGEELIRGPVKKFIGGNFNEELMAIAEAVRMAPSAMNRQPVRLLGRESEIHIFRKYVMFGNPFIAVPQCIDTGAAMAHIRVAAETLGYKTEFKISDQRIIWGRNIYQATAALEPADTAG